MPTKSLAGAVGTAGQNPLLPAKVRDPVTEAQIVAVTTAGTVFVLVGNRVVQATPVNDGQLRVGRQAWVTQRDDGSVVIHGQKT